MFAPLLQEVLQELSRAGQGQVLKGICDPIPQFQHVQPTLQPKQMDHISGAKSAEGSIDQTCEGRRGGRWMNAPNVAVSSPAVTPKTR